MNTMVHVGTGKRFENPLPGVPVVESPFFNELMADMEIDETTRAIAEHLHTHGWAAIDFPDPDFDAVAERIKKSLHGSIRLGPLAEGRVAEQRRFARSGCL